MKKQMICGLLLASLLMSMLVGCQKQAGLTIAIENKSIIPLNESHYLINLVEDGPRYWYIFNRDTWECTQTLWPDELMDIVMVFDGRCYATYTAYLSDESSQTILYSFNLDGSDLRDVIVMQDQRFHNRAFVGYQGRMYYLDYSLYRCDASGQNQQLVLDDKCIIDFTIADDTICYLSWDLPPDFQDRPGEILPPIMLKAYNMNTKQRTTLAEVGYDLVLKVHEGWVYYSNAQDVTRLYRCRLDGTQNQPLPEEWYWQPQIIDNALYWIDEEARAIQALDLATMKKRLFCALPEGEWSNWYMRGDDLFITSFGGGSNFSLYLRQQDGSWKDVRTSSVLPGR